MAWADLTRFSSFSIESLLDGLFEGDIFLENIENGRLKAWLWLARCSFASIWQAFNLLIIIGINLSFRVRKSKSVAVSWNSIATPKRPTKKKEWLITKVYNINYFVAIIGSIWQFFKIIIGISLSFPVRKSKSVAVSWNSIATPKRPTKIKA